MEETRSLAETLQDAWKLQHMAVVATGPARVVVLCNTAEPNMPVGYPPCLIEGEKLDENLPRGKSGRFLEELLNESSRVLQRQTVNDVRVDLGEDPANGLWLWGGGPIRGLNMASRKLGFNGVMVTQSALARGMASLCSIEVLNLDDQGAGARAAVGDVKAFQGDALAVEAGDDGAIVAQARLVGHLGADRDALGKGAAQTDPARVGAGMNNDCIAVVGSDDGFLNRSIWERYLTDLWHLPGSRRRSQ